VGVKDHVSIGDGAIVGAKSGVIGDVKAGQFVSGHYGRPHMDDLRTRAHMQSIPKLMKTVAALEHRLAELEGGKKGS
jgi:UDP-3-O-[3-hydroxymyristoyl] glucosamine N-acyltransferase